MKCSYKSYRRTRLTLDIRRIPKGQPFILLGWEVGPDHAKLPLNRFFIRLEDKIFPYPNDDDDCYYWNIASKPFGVKATIQLLPKKFSWRKLLRLLSRCNELKKSS